MSRGVNLLLAAGVGLLTLAAIETALAFLHPTDYLDVQSKDADDLFKEVLHQSSPIPGLSFELSPNRQKKIEGVWIRTNTHGMRDAEPLAIEDDASATRRSTPESPGSRDRGRGDPRMDPG